MNFPSKSAFYKKLDTTDFKAPTPSPINTLISPQSGYKSTLCVQKLPDILNLKPLVNKTRRTVPTKDLAKALPFNENLFKPTNPGQFATLLQPLTRAALNLGKSTSTLWNINPWPLDTNIANIVNDNTRWLFSNKKNLDLLKFNETRPYYVPLEQLNIVPSKELPSYDKPANNWKLTKGNIYSQLVDALVRPKDHFRFDEDLLKSALRDMVPFPGKGIYAFWNSNCLLRDTNFLNSLSNELLSWRNLRLNQTFLVLSTQPLFSALKTNTQRTKTLKLQLLRSNGSLIKVYSDLI